MALNKVTYVDGETIIGAANLNAIQDEIISQEANKVPTSRKINNNALTSDVTLTAADVGAVPTSRKVNNKALSSDITLTATDVSALPMNPESIEMTPSSSSAGHGGFIDFHFNRDSGDRTSRIIESASGVITITPKLTLGTPLDVASGGTGNSSVDTTPTENSTKMVTSGGVYSAIAATHSVTTQSFSANSYPYLGSNAFLVYNKSCATVCIRGVKDIPPSASTKLFPFPSAASPTQNYYEDYITSSGNHFRLIAISGDGLYVYNYQQTATTDSDLQKTLTWVL